MAYVIEAAGLKKTFADVTAVDGISFQVNQGECFGILGPNGAGKTTTVRMVYGFSPKTAGTLKVFGLDIETGVAQHQGTRWRLHAGKQPRS